MQNRPNLDGTDIRARVVVERDFVSTAFEKWAKPGHFCRVLGKGPETTTWVWNIHSDAHDFDCQVDSLEEISRRIFSAHFGQLAIIFLWLGGMYFHGARFSNYAEWLKYPSVVRPTAQQVWSVVGQEILNGELGGGDVFGIRITSGFFYLWRGVGITDSSELYCTAVASLFMAGLLVYAGWFHYHKAAPGLEWFSNVDSMLNHHLSGLLGLGSLSWSGHLIHVGLPITKLLDAGVSPEEVPAPYEFLVNRDLMGALYPSFKKGLMPFLTLNWREYCDFLTFKGGLNPITGSLWVTDVAHHHLAVSVFLIFAGHMYRTNWGIGYTVKEILEGHHHRGVVGAGHAGLYEILVMSWHAQLAINLAMLGSLTIVVAHHMYSMPPYPFLGSDYSTQLSLFVHHMWIGGFCIGGAGAHASIFMVRDYNPMRANNNLVDRVLRHRDVIISHLNWVCIFLGLHSFGVYIHNDTMRALGRSGDMFSDSAISLQPIFAKWVQFLNFHAPGSTAPNALAASSCVFGGDVVSVNGTVVMLPIRLGTADFMVHHIHAFTIHVAVLVLLKGTLFARNSRLIPDKANLGFRFPCDGPGRGGTCQVSAWDHVFLGLFWVYNCISVAIFHFSWKLQSDVWGVVLDTGKVLHITAGNFSTSALTINGWLRDFLWGQSSIVIQTYGSGLSSYGLIFLGAHFIWAFSLMFLFSGRGYWQELIESIMWAHAKLKLEVSLVPRALSITQGRVVGLAHYLLGGIGVTWSFFLSRVFSLG